MIEFDGIDWKRRALAAEKKLNDYLTPQLRCGWPHGMCLNLGVDCRQQEQTKPVTQTDTANTARKRNSDGK